MMKQFLTATISLLCLQAFAADQPNVIVIMADDMGYGDLSCYGATTFKTPHIDALAAGGQRFTQGYCSASTCTPTRYSLLTGNYAFRKPGTGIAPPNGPLNIDADTFTLPDVMKKAGYQTAVIGKWHLGLGEKGKGPDWNGEIKPGPREIGFDHHFLLPTTNDRVPQVYVTESRVLNLDPADPLWVGMKKPSADHPTGLTHRETLKQDWSHGHNSTIHNGISRIGFYTGGHKARFRDEDLADKWVEKSNAFIEENKDKPFFLFYASHDLHVPRIPHERFQGVTPHGFRADSIVQLDWTVGEIVKTLDRLKIRENTLIVFCSDNGPVMDDGYQDEALEKLGEHKAAGIYKGGKYSVYEGGTRTPFITNWPGKIPAGESKNIVCTIDLASSLATMTGTEIPTDAFLDSMNVSDAMLGKADSKGRTQLVQQDNGGKGKYGYRSGQWKLTHHAKKSARNTTIGQTLANTKVPEFQLYNLSKDPSETTDLLVKRPEVAERLKAELAKAIADGRTRN
ncbi:arylsulfatase [Akkermansiaceae bacterium]|nr:arylsulfatase [Akkermansiaceae bacterium]MDB4436109.1 arylsulfatase [Akkermansiaceae bacterium]